MTINKCRVCGNNFFEKPLLEYENMPSAAQNLPDAESLPKDFGIDMEVRQCSGCGLVQLNNEPVPYYKEVIRASAFSDEMKEFRLKQFKEFVEKYSLKGKKILEAGCGSGEYLSIMEQSGAEVYGIEQSEKAVQQCLKNGLNVSRGFIDGNTKLNHSPFDAFFMITFLEHLPEPNLILRGIWNNLADDAVGIVEVPNFDMILEKKLFSEFIRDHLFYFTKNTLETTLKLNGFEIIECKEVWHDYIISAVVKKIKKANISDFYKYQEKLKIEINKHIEEFGSKNVAIWGAGHQALAIISMLGLADKIRYVVDSALFKQNKYTPATHIPIVAPAMLDTEPVKAVIVMAASYSDEVAGIIRKKYGNKIDISILRDYGLESAKNF